MLQQALGGRSAGDLKQTIDKTKNDLKKLRRDMKETPEAAGALDSYIQMFDVIGSLVPGSNPHDPEGPSKPAKPQQQPPAKK